MSSAAEPGIILEHLFRHQAGRMVAHLTRLLGPAWLSVAEEAVQESMLRALQSWPYQGVPENPAGWLFRVAHNSAIDTIRRNKTFGDKTDAVVAELSRSATVPDGDPALEEQLRDDELRMIFMCCHPAIAHESSVALSLKTVGGFNVREIARAFLADDAAIAQRLVRAKRLIRDQSLTLEMPHGADLQRRLDAVAEVIYFMFNEGYAALEGEALIRSDLCQEALRLGRLMASSSIATPPLHALVALMALQAARLPAAQTVPAILCCSNPKIAAGGTNALSPLASIISIAPWRVIMYPNITFRPPLPRPMPAPCRTNLPTGRPFFACMTS